MSEAEQTGRLGILTTRVPGKRFVSLPRPRAGSRLPTKSLGRAIVLITPFAFLFIVFQLGPIWAAIYNSFLEFSLLGEPVGWTGLDNYEAVLSSTDFLVSLVLTVIFVVAKVSVQLVLGVAAALLVLQRSWFTSLIRSVVFLPTATAIVAVTLMFSFLFDRELGLVNAVLSAVGLQRVDWLLEPEAAQTVMLIVSLWRDTGFVMLVFLAGLQAVPATLLDAVRVDGASAWQEIRYVTLPLLTRSFQFAAVFATLACARFVAPIDLMTQGGPQQATDVATYHIYRHAFTYFAWAETSAMSVVLLMLLLVITLALLALFRARWEY